MKWLVLGACAIALVSGATLYDNPEDHEAEDDIPSKTRFKDPWVNGFDHQFKFTCPRGKGMIRVRSHHNSWFEDRQFDFDCEGNSMITHHCMWTGYVNSMRGDMSYTCPHNHVITGVDSYHQNGKEDRRFKFECCKVNGKVDHCSNSGIVNNYDHQLNFGSSAKFITGWKSTFSWFHKDRKFSFDVCEIGHGSSIGK